FNAPPAPKHTGFKLSVLFLDSEPAGGASGNGQGPLASKRIFRRDGSERGAGNRQANKPERVFFCRHCALMLLLEAGCKPKPEDGRPTKIFATVFIRQRGLSK